MEGTQEVDAIWRALNPWGKYQVFQLCLLLIDFFPASFAILSAVFTGYLPEFTCEDSAGKDSSIAAGNGTSESYVHVGGDQCKYNVYSNAGNSTAFIEQRSCNSFKYSNELSYAYEWNLICSRSSLAALAQSLVLAGQGLGALIMSHVSDRFGRKTVHVLAHIGVLITMVIMAFSTNIYMLLVLRLVTGTFQQGIVCTGKVLGLENFPKEIRSHIEVLGFLAWSGGIMCLALYGYVFREIDWRYLQIGVAAFSIYALAEWWMMDESVRWLISNGRIDEAKRILKKAARWNKVDYSVVEQIFNENIHLQDKPDEKNAVLLPVTENGFENNEYKKIELTKSDNETSSSGSSSKLQKFEKYTVIDILKNPALRINTLILWYAWVVATGTYYGMTLVSSHLAGDRFVNFFLSGVIEVPSLLFEFYLFNKIGRKKTMILWYALAGLSLIISTTLLFSFAGNVTVKILATVFTLIGKSASTGSFSTVFLYTPEIYPTNYRNSGLGIASSVSRIGGILAPFASNLALIALWIPGAIFGGMCLLVVLLALRLPESAKHELPSTIAECDKWEKDSIERKQTP